MNDRGSSCDEKRSRRTISRLATLILYYSFIYNNFTINIDISILNLIKFINNNINYKKYLKPNNIN